MTRPSLSPPGAAGSTRPAVCRASAMAPQPDEVLVDLLRRTPRSASFRFRKATGRGVASGLFGLDSRRPIPRAHRRRPLAAGRDQRQAEPCRRDAGREIGVAPGPVRCRGRRCQTSTRSIRTTSAGARAAQQSGGFKNLVEDPESANSLLEALIRHAAQLEMAEAASFLSSPRRRSTPGSSPRAATVEGARARAARDRCRRDGAPGPSPTAALRPLDRSARRLELRCSRSAWSRATKRRQPRGHVVQRGAAQEVSTRRFADFRTSLDELAPCPRRNWLVWPPRLSTAARIASTRGSRRSRPAGWPTFDREVIKGRTSAATVGSRTSGRRAQRPHSAISTPRR